MCLPITLLHEITAQCITSRCHALPSIQPIKNSDALFLDKQITRKVHAIMGFLYHGNTDILMLPVDCHGMDFPSIMRINMGLAVDGLAHDLNHHIPAYCEVVLITLADWPSYTNPPPNANAQTIITMLYHPLTQMQTLTQALAPNW
jgi:hypothetical protein